MTLAAMRAAHSVFIGSLTCRAWVAKLSRNEAKIQKDRYDQFRFRIAT